jgi:hypothetical protein
MDSPLIYSAIANIMAEVKAIEKSQKNQQQGFMFRGIDNVMNDLHAIFAKHQVFVAPEVQSYNVDAKTTARGGVLYFTHATIKFTFYATDSSSISITTVGEAMDSADKGMNKAMSVALKYALMQMLLIPTKEDKDPDAHSPEETLPETISDIVARLNPDNPVEFTLITALNDVQQSSTKDTLKAVYTAYPTLQTDKTFLKCLSMRKKEIGL